MFNPLLNLSQYTDSQLETKLMELQRKYFQTQNPELRSQIAITLEDFRSELYTRRSIAAQKQREQYQQNGGNDLDSLININ